MNELKLKIISLLEENAKISPENISAATGEDLAKVKSSIKELEEEGVIVKYTTIINRELIEDGVEAYIEVSVTPVKSKGFDAIAEEIIEFPEVENVFLMSGAYDLAVVIHGKTLKQVAMFVSDRLSTLESVTGTKTHFILKKYKVSGIITHKKDQETRNLVQF